MPSCSLQPTRQSSWSKRGHRTQCSWKKFRIQCCAVQATSKTLSTMVLQERARWLNFNDLPDKEKDELLDMLIVPEGLFDSALASMWQRCEAKNQEGEAQQLCLPRKVAIPQLLRQKPLVNPAIQGPQYRITKQVKPILNLPALNSWADWSEPPSSSAAAPLA